MRVITGKYRGRHFDVPNNFKARPTTDFAKENLFNMLRGYIELEETEVLDLFAGTGSISLEFLSRGCNRVVSVEKDSRHFAFIRSVMFALKDQASVLHRMDALKYIEKSEDSFDLVFADPPYALPELPELPDMVMQSRLLKPGAIFILEHGKDYDFSQRPDFLTHRAYGSVNFSLFRKRE